VRRADIRPDSGLGVDDTRITMDGYRPDRPIQGNKTVEGRAAIRRVELTKTNT
jgi:outer membrane protein OmpA-like peptidoglycan-associated protein